MRPVKDLELDGTWWRSQEGIVWRQLWDEYDPGLYEAFRGRCAAPGTSREIDSKTLELLMIAVDSVVSWPYPRIDYHVHRAFDLGATVREIFEAVNLVGEFGGIHAVNDGLNALARVVRERELKGEPVAELAAVSSAPFQPIVADNQLWRDLLKKYDPKRADGLDTWSHRLSQFKEISPVTQQLIVVTVCCVTKLSARSFAGQIQLAFDVGCGVAAIVEAIMIAGHLEGIHTVEHGLTVLDSVVEQAKQRS